MPEVPVANKVERNSLLTMYAVRGYASTEEEQYLTEGKNELEHVKKYSATSKSWDRPPPGQAGRGGAKGGDRGWPRAPLS